MKFRNNIDFLRVVMSKAQRRKHFRKLKLEKNDLLRYAKRDGYEQIHEEMMNELMRFE